MSSTPYVGLKAAIELPPGTHLAVLDTNAILNVAMGLATQRWFVQAYSAHTVVVPAIVYAELAGKTHPESYPHQDGHTASTIAAARASATLLVPGSHWPTAHAPSIAFAYPTRAYWGRLAQQRLRENAGEDPGWLQWSPDKAGRYHSAPAMADHQVLLTAWGLQQDGYVAALLTNDVALKRAATRFGVAVRAVPC